MAKTSQQSAVANHRRRLAERGITRYEVRGLDADKALIRTLALRLAANDVEASQLRAAVTEKVAGEPSVKGGILAALRRSPMVGAGLDINRDRSASRAVDL
jgi:hypothetical protein